MTDKNPPAPTPEPRNLPCAVCGKSSTHDIHDKVVYSYAHEFEARTPETPRCKHGVWAADHCYQCEGETPSAPTPRCEHCGIALSGMNSNSDECLHNPNRAAPGAELSAAQMRKLNEECAELRKDCIRLNDDAATLREKLATAEREREDLRVSVRIGRIAAEAELARVREALQEIVAMAEYATSGIEILKVAEAALRTGGEPK